MYTTEAEYEAYTGKTAPIDYERQELYATTLFKAMYPNFPSEEQFVNLDSATQNHIKYAIFEQIDSDADYSGSKGGGSGFSVGNFSISDGTTSNEDRLSSLAYMYLEACGATYKGVGTCH